ncbi:hypothetical protein LY76DRAFT_624209, partial [Colletotrichum caudatum]
TNNGSGQDDSSGQEELWCKSRDDKKDRQTISGPGEGPTAPRAVHGEGPTFGYRSQAHRRDQDLYI